MENNQEKGYLALILHAHLPFVRHPEYEDFLEESWFYEAMTETYVPLIKMMDELLEDNIDFRLTMTLSPSLVSMFRDPLLISRYLKKLDNLIELSVKEVERNIFERSFFEVALMYKTRLLEVREIFVNRYKQDMVTAFKKFQDLKKLEIITCPATHGFLPLMSVSKIATRAQIKVGIDFYEKIFGIKPRGIWLPECGYYPGLDDILKEFGIKYFILENHGISNAAPKPKYGVYAPVCCPSGVVAFGRDPESSKQVWSSVEGYPGDYDYREFYRDIGFELDFDYIKPYIHKDGIRVNTGIKYYRITGKTEDKQPYIPMRAKEKAAVHAGNFMHNREKKIEYLYSATGKRPIIVAPYDAELFGHWWFEGPDFLDSLFRKIASDQKSLKLVTPSEYLSSSSLLQVCIPQASSWGDKGYNEVWLNGSNDWIYRHLHISTDRMIEMASTNKNTNGLRKRALNQAARELLLAQSSDWAFIIKTGTMAEYAIKRIKDHVLRFNYLYEAIKNDNIGEEILCDMEAKDNIFPDIDYLMYCEDKKYNSRLGKGGFDAAAS